MDGLKGAVSESYGNTTKFAITGTDAEFPLLSVYQMSFEWFTGSTACEQLSGTEDMVARQPSFKGANKNFNS